MSFEMDPFLRPATVAGALAKPAPDGWTTSPAGQWRGRLVEVVYDDRIHDVALLRAVAPPIAAALANAGWRLCGVDGEREWWVRDRVTADQRRPAFTRPRARGIAMSR